MDKTGRIVVITGASGGIGRACAVAFGRQGAIVALLARGEAGLAGAAREAEAAGGRAWTLSVDVAVAEGVEAAAERIERELGPIDVWVNVAFTSVFSPLSEISAPEFRRVTEVSYLGYVYGTMAALKRMRPRNRGVIVQVGSALAYRGIPLQTAYGGAKHAIQGFHESLRCELLHKGSGIRTTMVQMPAVNTPQFSWVLSRLPHQAQPVKIMAHTAATCTHPGGRWQRSAADDRIDAALLLPAIRGAVPAHDPRSLATAAAVREELLSDGYVYRFREGPGPMADVEGAFLLCGFNLALTEHQQGHTVEAFRLFERNRAACGSPGLFTEEYDVEQHQLRGNFPQAFVRAAMLETAHRLTGPPAS